MKVPIAGSILPLLLVTGCAAPTVERDASYLDAEALKNAAVAAGYSCQEWKPLKAVGREASVGQCSVNDLFVVFLAEEDAKFSADKTAAGGSVVLYARNWLINPPRERLLPLQAKLGGKIIGGSWATAAPTR